MVIIYLNKLKSSLRDYYLLSLFKIISKISNSKEPLGMSISKNQEGALILPRSFMMRMIL
ncbi:hypothetical protein KUHS_16820 [Streptococcus salivarius]